MVSPWITGSRDRASRNADTIGTTLERIKAIAEQCGTSAQMIEQHYGRYMSSDFGARMMAEISETEMKTEMDSEANLAEKEISQAQSAVSGEREWRPRRDLNPCYRRERPVSWAELDDGDDCW